MKIPRMILAFALSATLVGTAISSRASGKGAAPAPIRAAKSGDDAAKASLSPTSVAAHTAASGDVLLESLLTELDRSRAQLKMDQVAPPYYIEYRVNDVEDYAAEAAFGALRENQHMRYRVLRVVVRIGDYKQDSYYSQGMGEAEVLPLDDDPIALRHQIWLATDEAYKAAGQAFTEKQAALKQFSADANPVDDFARAPVVTALSPTVKLEVDEAAWRKAIEDASGLYRQYPDVQTVSAAVRRMREEAVDELPVATQGRVTGVLRMSEVDRFLDGDKDGRGRTANDDRSRRIV